MIECSMPQDILKYKAKFIGNFSAREVVFLGISGTVALVAYFMLFTGLSMQPRIFASAILATPFLVVGFVTIFGQPLEKILPQIIYDNLLCPPVRTKEIHFPEYEKYENLHSFECISEDLQDLSEDKNKKKKNKNGNTERKIAKSKEYKAIR